MNNVFFFINMIRNILMNFFQEAIWVAGFFFLLNKTFDNRKLKQFSKITLIIVCVFLFIFSVLRSV
ncbi:hypothetical protein RJP21_19680 [Paenibacillus sp. VCA1]|uniref:hypothetical protein n=1 Tax=Paenibacillus sp. VCA1 TaxID=3039148 RepID=UPI002870CEEF|nr:hypothetical protein [Paenibacillus sp. VCA1]MDR9855839.1 hypothetical protein [Paenibacillus sp. VCA1]